MRTFLEWLGSWIFFRCRRRDVRPVALMLGVAGVEPPGWRVVLAATLDEAQALLAREEIPVVLCESAATGADWKRAVHLLAAAPCHPSVVLLSPPPHPPLWIEVTAAGGYDVLCEPVSAAALDHAIRSATSHWRSRRAIEAARTNAFPTR
ncbi:MAG: hypothetical protein LAP40_27925 [Acidobacteriia bacterium]|nr:hypothetical protein [Terriglobia bacterium]